MADVLPTLPGVPSLANLERLIDATALTAGFAAVGESKPANALTVWRTLRDLYFSVPVSPEQQTWDDAKREQIFEEHMRRETGVSKTVWLAAMRRKLRTAARQRAREQQLKRGKR